MKLTISYAELQEYVASHFHKTVNVGHVDGENRVCLFAHQGVWLYEVCEHKRRGGEDRGHRPVLVV